MTVGIRIRDENTGALRMEVTDYTVSNLFTETMFIGSTSNRDGYRVVAGIGESTHVAFFVPCFDPGPSGPLYYYIMPRMPKVWISGSVVYWGSSQNSDVWTDGYYTLRVVRIQ